LLLAALAFSAGCGDGKRGDGPGRHEEAGKAEARAGEGKHAPDRVKLTPAALVEAGLEVARPGPARLETTLELPGEVIADPDRVAHLTPRAAGVAVEVRAALGAQVKTGDVLAVIESADLGVAKTDYLAAQRDLELAKFDGDREKTVSENTQRLLDLLAKEPTPEEARKGSAGAAVGEDKAKLLTAYSNLYLARKSREREEDLFRRKIGSESEVLAARAALETAEAEYTAARESVFFGHRARLLDAERALKVAEATLQTRERHLHILGIPEAEVAGIGSEPDDRIARYALRSPIAGAVVEKHVALGENLETTSRVFVVVDLSSVQVRVSVPPGDLARVRRGQRVRVRVDAGATPHEGTVEYLSPVADERTRTVEARLSLPNADGSLRPGLFASARVVVEEAAVPLAVPVEAVLRHENGDVVFVREGEGEFEVRPVKLGRRDDKAVEILEGLKAGEHVVVKNAFTLKAELGKEAGGHGH